MRYILLITILFLACNNKQGKRKDSSQSNAEYVSFFKSYNDSIVTIDTISKAKYDSYKRNDLSRFLDTTKVIKKDHIFLKLPIDDGSFILFRDLQKVECDEPIGIYSNQGIIKNMNYYLISATNGHHSYNYSVVNKSNGKLYNLIDIPRVSPNNNYIFSFSSYLEFPIKPTGFQLWMIKKNGLLRKDNVRLDKWEIGECKWINDSQIALKIVCPNEKDVVYGLLKIKDNTEK